MGTEQRMVVAKGPGLKLGSCSYCQFFLHCFSNYYEGYEKHLLLRHE